MRNRTVIVLGADGYLGWPQSMYLSDQGYRVIAVDDLVRRRWDLECGTSFAAHSDFDHGAARRALA